MEIRMTIPKEFEEHFKNDQFKDSLGRIKFDLAEYIKLKETNDDVIPVSGNYEKELADALPQMFESAEIVLSDEETTKLRKEVKDRLNMAYPWTEKYELAYSYDYGEESILLLIENPVAQRQALIAENLTEHTYKVEKEPGTNHTLVDATPEAMEKLRDYIENI